MEWKPLEEWTMSELQKIANKIQFDKLKDQLDLYSEDELSDFETVIINLQKRLKSMYMSAVNKQYESFFVLASLVRDSSVLYSHWSATTTTGALVYISYRKGILVAEVFYPKTRDYKTIYINHIGDRNSSEMDTADMIKHIGLVFVEKQ